MVSVNEKCYIERLANENDYESSSLQKTTDFNLSSSSDDIENLGNGKWEHINKFSESHWVNGEGNEETLTNGKSGSSSCFSRPIIPKSLNSNHSSSKRIVWDSQVINHINNTLRESTTSSLNNFPSTEKNNCNDSFITSSEGEVGYFKKVFTGNGINYLKEKNEEHFSDSRSYNLQFQKKLKNISFSKGKTQEIYIKSKRSINAIHREQSGDKEDSHRRNILIPFYYKQQKTVDYDEILNRIRQCAIVFEDWAIANQPKIALLGDSHTRFLGEIIMKMLPWFKVETTVKPGAKSRWVLSSLQDLLQNMGMNDFVVIISGTNDMWSESLVDAKAVMYDAINDSTGTNLILCSVPNNYLEPFDSTVQDNILNINQYYEEIVNASKCAHLVNLYELKERRLFTKHGLHFNQDGKIKICEMVSLKILEILDSIKT